jgi:DNA topoisomerase-1
MFTAKALGDLMHLIICEKQKAAQRIATILSSGKANRNFFNRVAVYDFSTTKNEKYKIVGLKGHIINLDFPKEFARWSKLNLTDLVQIKPIKKIKEWNIVNVIKKIAKEIESVIIATDYDREGELIGVEGLDIIRDLNPEISIKRARFSALTGQEIHRAFKNLTEVDYNLSSAANSRQIIDLKWGAVLTRFISLASNQTGRDFLSAGRVQSPTLALIVDRENEINDFDPKPYWLILAHLKKERKFIASHHSDKFWDQEKAKKIFEKIKDEKFAKTVSLSTKEVNEYPPAPFNTTSFLRAATSLKISASKVMSIAEELYTNGLISYPRTDNTVYPRSLNLRKILEMFKDSPFSNEASEILNQDRIYPSAGKITSTDHPPIHPVGVAKEGELKPPQWKIYELIVRRFFATLAPKAIAKVTDADFEIKSEPFKANGYEYIEKGWLRYYTYFENKEKFLPPLVEGEEVEIENIEMPRKETLPPKRYSQGSLIQEMDKLGLGTKSTRHEIIQKLYNRGYIEQSIPVPTLIGSAVILALENYATRITQSEMTSTLEKDMDEIANGKKKMEEVVQESEEMLEEILKTLNVNMEKIGKSIQLALQSQNVMGICKLCKSELVIRKSFRGKRFIGCSNYPKCKNSYPLPQNGKILANGDNCEYCGSPIIEMISMKKKKIKTCVNMDCKNNKLRQK